MKQLKVGVAVGLAVLVTCVATQSASAFKEGIHEDITHESLGFMRPDVVGDMDGEHAQADIADALENRVHFDGCTFKEGSELITRGITTRSTSSIRATRTPIRGRRPTSSAI
jgi:hypothetical protein